MATNTPTPQKIYIVTEQFDTQGDDRDPNTQIVGVFESVEDANECGIKHFKGSYGTNEEELRRGVLKYYHDWEEFIDYNRDGCLSMIYDPIGPESHLESYYEVSVTAYEVRPRSKPMTTLSDGGLATTTTKSPTQDSGVDLPDPRNPADLDASQMASVTTSTIFTNVPAMGRN